jgi:hypothetical protein
LRYVDHFSASPLDFFFPNVMHPLWGAWLAQSYAQNIAEKVLYLGLVPVALAAAGLAVGWDRVRATFAWLGVIFAVLALGTTLHWMNAPLYISVPAGIERLFTVGMGFVTRRLAFFPISSYDLRVEGAIYLPLPSLLLYLYLPFFSAMRVWSRLGLMTVLSVSVLAGYGLQGLRQRMAGPDLDRRFKSLAQLVTLGALALTIVEYTAVPYALGHSRVQARPVDKWLANQQGDFSIMEFPLVKALSGPPLYATQHHGKKISFGYGTFFPRAFDQQRAVLELFPSKESVALLKEWEVRYVLVGEHSYGEAWPQVERDLATANGLRYVLTQDDQPVYKGDRLLHLLPGTERAFVVDRMHVFEVL